MSCCPRSGAPRRRGRGGRGRVVGGLALAGLAGRDAGRRRGRGGRPSASPPWSTPPTSTCAPCTASIPASASPRSPAPTCRPPRGRIPLPPRGLPPWPPGSGRWATSWWVRRARCSGSPASTRSSASSSDGPIAQFQAVRHRLAEAYVAIEAADAALGAAWDDGTPFTAAMAKAVAGRSARTVSRHCQQVLAGIGFTTEHDLHLYVRRVIVLDRLLGDSRSLTRRLGEDLLARSHRPLAPAAVTGEDGTGPTPDRTFEERGREGAATRAGDRHDGRRGRRLPARGAHVPRRHGRARRRPARLGPVVRVGRRRAVAQLAREEPALGERGRGRRG